jgi:hypothetical protein
MTCLANNFLSTLSTSQQSSVQLSLTSTNATQYWSNLPAGMATRKGLSLGSLTTAQKTAAMALVNAALTSTGQAQVTNNLLADDYLNTAGGGSTYGSGNYYISFLGTPSTSGAWILEFTGHHYTYLYSINASATPVSLTPNFVGLEPVSFTSSGSTIQGMATRQQAFLAMISSLSSTQLASAKITGISDLVVGPQADGKFPTQSGLAVSSLSDSQKALVKAAIATYAQDANGTGQYDAYTSDTARASTTIAWANYSDLATKGSYVRIDGPRVWIEFSVQGGVILSANHYHTVWRDKTYDYGGNFSF